MPTKIPCPLCLRSRFTSALEAESRLGFGVVGVTEGGAGEDVSLGAAVGVGLRVAAAVGVGLRVAAAAVGRSTGGTALARSASEAAIVVVFSWRLDRDLRVIGNSFVT